MPLGILLILVAAGIGGVGLLLHLLGFSRGFVIIDTVAAQREWRRHWPADTVTGVCLAANGRVALVGTQAGQGLLRSFGADTVAHRIAGVMAEPGGLRFGFGDFAAPPVFIALDDVELRGWRAALGER
ncbi:MAG: hypothetical protein U1D06_06890 [Paracoccaceae bacterium]|nr:hypothetical protein [Paracoccaceae bacterium]